MPQHLVEADIIISATSCPVAFITKKLIEQTLLARKNKPMFFIDLAMPCDIEHTVAELSNVILYNLDMLQETINLGLEHKRDAAMKAEHLINLELHNYSLWINKAQASASICEYRQQMLAMAKSELERALSKFAHPEVDQHAILHEFCARMLRKFMHMPTVGLQKAAIDGREDLFILLQYLYRK